FSADDSYFIHDHASIYYESVSWPINDALLSPGLVTTKWDPFTYTSPINVSNTNYLPFSAVFTVPAVTSGSTYYVMLKVNNGTTTGFATAGSAQVAFAVEASCCKVLVHNRAGYGEQFSLTGSADVIYDGCQSPTRTPTPVLGSPTNTPTLTQTRTPTLTFTPTSTHTITLTASPTATATPTYTPTSTSTPSGTYTPT
ncbi:MAG: hypothetical protein V4498_04035, partial [candidate division FCPU426 bacterium]